MESSIANNPLAKHFRQPAIFLKLPSGGRFYPPGALDLNVTGEIPIYPMTVKDELLLKTPDALMNGSSVAEMIGSCCPAIKDPWNMPLVDLDPVLIAIRLASYGADMDMTSNCSHCKEENEHTIDLRKVLDSIKPVTNYDKHTFVDGLIFDLEPQTFREINLASQIGFEQQKLVAVVGNSELSDEDKKALFNESFAKLTEMNVNTLVNCIKSITTEDGTIVTEKELIKDFLVHTDRKSYDSIRELIMGIIKENALEPMSVPCAQCQKEYTVSLDFNQSNFFV
jgi:thiol-disulfide isomerase/thioredoxin